MAETLYFNKRANLCVGLNGTLEPIKFSYSIIDKTILYMYMYNVKTRRQQSFIEGDLPLDVYINNLHGCDSLCWFVASQNSVVKQSKQGRIAHLKCANDI